MLKRQLFRDERNTNLTTQISKYLYYICFLDLVNLLDDWYMSLIAGGTICWTV